MSINTTRISLNKFPDKCSSIEDFIATGEYGASITYYNFSILQVERSEDDSFEIHFTIDNVINDYLDIIKEAATNIQLTPAEQRKYFYNPDLLSYDLYGTTELDFLILIMNGILDPKEFNMPNILLLGKNELTKIVGRIYTAENRYIKMNREENELKMPAR